MAPGGADGGGGSRLSHHVSRQLLTVIMALGLSASLVWCSHAASGAGTDRAQGGDQGFLPLLAAGDRQRFLPLVLARSLPVEGCLADWPSLAVAHDAWRRSSRDLAAGAAAQFPGPGPAIRFEDATRGAGVTAVTASFGLAWADFDADGDEDVFLSNHGAPPHLFVNQADGTFAESAAAMGIPLRGRDGHGTAWGDYDGDGDLDLLIVQGKTLGEADRLDQLYRNDGEQGFALVTESVGVGNSGGRARSASWVDYDGDGDLDLLTVNFQTPSLLYENVGEARLRSLSPFVTNDEGYWRTLGALGGAWSDMDLDGDLDLFLSGNRNALLAQKQGGFQDVTKQALGTYPVEGTGAAWGDYDNDGYPDLYLARGLGREVDFVKSEDFLLRAGGTTGQHWEGVDFQTMGGLMLSLYRNGAQRPAEVYVGDQSLQPERLPFMLAADDVRACGEPTDNVKGSAYRVWHDCPSGLWHLRWRGEESGAEFTVQLNAQCTLEEVVSVHQTLTDVREMPNILLRNNGGATFSDVSSAAGVADPGNARGAVWLDGDNDGWLDLYVVNNGNARVGNEANRLYHNQGDGRFLEIGEAAGVAGDASGRGGAVAWADYDSDGWADLFVTNGLGPPPEGVGPHRLYHNAGGSNHWLEVKLAGRNGTLGSGARAVLWANGRAQVRQQTGGAGLFSQNSQVLHFGLGEATRVARLEIEWPSGFVQIVTDLPSDVVVTLEEPGG